MNQLSALNTEKSEKPLSQGEEPTDANTERMEELNITLCNS